MFRYPKKKELEKFSFIGIGKTAFSRLGPEKSLPNYKIIYLNDADEDVLIKNKVKIEKIDIKEKEYKSTILNVLSNKKVIDFIKSQKNPILYLYFVNSSVENFLQKNNIRFIGTKNSKFHYLRSKADFYKLLDDIGIKTPKYLIKRKRELNFLHLRNKLGNFVIQCETRGGGQGTVFVFNKKDFEKSLEKFKNLSPDEKLRVTQYIDGISPSMTLCITGSGVIRSPLQHQILSPKEAMNPELGMGRFAGHDWSSYNFDKDIEKQADTIAEKLGKYLKGKYSGILGVDFIIDKKSHNLYPVECNPRLLGSFPVFSMVQERLDEPQILYYHFLSSIFPWAEIEVNSINKKTKKRKKGAQILFYNRNNEELEIQKSLKNGVYILDTNELKFLRTGYNLSELRGSKEFIITDGVFQKGTILKKNKKIGRLLTLNQVLKDDCKDLNRWTTKILSLIYKHLGGEK